MSEPVAAGQRTILIVEDDEDISHLLAFILRREGFELHTAAEGQTAQRLLDEIAPPSLILLDVMLPYADGFQLVSQIRNKPQWENVPIVMLTAKSQERDIVRALDAGANDYVLKPFQPQELMARLRRFLKVSH